MPSAVLASGMYLAMKERQVFMSALPSHCLSVGSIKNPGSPSVSISPSPPCDVASTGKLNAKDILAVISAMKQRHEIDAASTVVMGQSFGGWNSLAVAAMAPPEVKGIVNFVGGIRSNRCNTQDAAMWEAMFASPSLHQYRVYSYAIASSPPDIFKGVSAGLRLPWGGVTRDAMPVELTSFNVDSDAAYQAAAADGAAWLKKNPDKPLSAFALGNTSRFSAPVWYLMWGDKKSGYVAYVDATTGKVLKQK